MKKLLIKTAVLAAILASLAMTVTAHAEPITVGNDTAAREEADGWSDFVVVDKNHPVSLDGWLTIFKYYALDQSPFRFILIDGSNTVRWVSEQITPAGEGVNVFAPDSAVEVKAGWNLGLYIVETGSIPYESHGALASYTAEYSGLPGVGNILSFTGSINRTYSFVAAGDTQVTTPPTTVSVTVVQYLDGGPATAASANNTYFLINDSWSDPNIGSGSSRFALGPVGLNTDSPYQAVTASMTGGASYNISEDTNQYAVGTTCGNGRAYRLAGYTVGDTMAEAAAATPNLMEPNLTLTGSKYVIVWNNTCAQDQTIVAGNDTNGTDIRPILDTFGDFVIIDTNHPVSANGWLTNFHYYAANLNPFRFVLVDGSDVVQWVSDEIIPPETGIQTFTVSAPVPAQKGWNVGLYFAATGNLYNGTIPYEYTGAPAYYRSNYSGSPLPAVGKTLVYENSSNRIYSFAATGVTSIPLPETVSVTVVKYLDGTRADAASANDTSFPMQSIWSADNLNAGSSSFVLGPTGVNTSNSYEAVTPEMTSGAFYSVWEDTSQMTVGMTCDGDHLYRLAGYTTGETLAQAVTAKKTTKTPSLSNIASNQYVIVWNEACETDDCTDDNGHHYGNDKGDNHKDKCKDKKDKDNKDK
ncbi:MAG: hypothetical protein JXL20_08935 [Deltaproteobacteria bacterium]|nr:hypothetical protein [Deltaproteobacteria bacterium]